MKRALTLIVAIIMVCSCMLACTQATPETTTPAAAPAESNASSAPAEAAATDAGNEKADELIIQIDADPGSLHPYATMTTPYYRSIMRTVYQQLFKAYSAGSFDTFEGVIAESIKKVDDLHYEIKIKENVYDSAGNHFTAADAVFSYQMQEKLNSQAASYWAHADIEQCKAIDEYTFQLGFKDATPGFLTTLLLRTNMVTKAAFEAAGTDGEGMTTAPVGTGAYVVKEWTTGNSLVVEANPDYWDIENGGQNVQTVTFKVISESAQRGIEMEAGEVDFLYDVSANDKARFESMDGFNVKEIDSNRIMNLYFNCSDKSPCSNLALRQAIAYAIDAEGIAKAAYGGMAAAAYTLSRDSWADWNPDWTKDGIYYAQNMELAKEKLAESGYTSGLTLHFMVSEDPAMSMAAQIIQAPLAELGITVTIDQYETAVYTSNQTNDEAFDMYILQNRSDEFGTKVISDKLGYKSGTNSVWYIDDKLQELLKPYAGGNMTQDQVDELYAYYNTVIPIYTLCTMKDYLVTAKGIENVKTVVGGWVNPGELTFTSDFSR